MKDLPVCLLNISFSFDSMGGVLLHSNSSAGLHQLWL